MERISLTAHKRSPDHTTKGELNRARSEDKIPAVIYGRQKDAVPILLEGREFRRVLGTEAGSNVVIELSISNGKSSKSSVTETVMIKELQRDILVPERLLHVDLIRISLTEKQTVNVPLSLQGDPAGVKEGGILQILKREIEVSCLPTAIPDHLEIDVSALAVGDSLSAKDLTLPEGVELLEDPEETLVSVLAPEREEEPEEEIEEEAAAEGEEEEAPAEETAEKDTEE